MGSKYSKALLLGALVALPPAIFFVAANFWPDYGFMQPNDFYLGSDFVNYWMGGRLALLGRLDALYDIAAYNLLLQEWFSPVIRMMNFSYPPHALLLLAVFGALPYFAALILWSVLGAIGFVAIALGRRPVSTEWGLVAALVLAPVLWVNVVFGQMGLWLAILFIGALRALPTRPVLAGILAGVLTIKPQLGLLLPLLMLATGAWRAIGAAIVTALAMVALSIAAFGTAPWHVYLTETMPFQWQFIEQMTGFYSFQMITPYTALYFLGVPAQAALTVQVAISLAIALTTLLVARSDAPWPLKCAVVAFGSVLMVPYVLAYDLAAPYAALIWHLIHDHPAEDKARVMFAGILWALPFALTIAAQIAGIPLLPVVLLAAFVWLAGEALGWRPFAHVKSAFASIRA
jgi:hypothetical protein